MYNPQKYYVYTPEGVKLSYLLASPVERFYALVLDSLILHVSLTVVSTITYLTFQTFFQENQGRLFDGYQGLWVLAYFICITGYNIFFEWLMKGQTPGKRVLKLMVVDVNYKKIKLSQIILRNLLRAVDKLPLSYVLGGIVFICSRYNQRLGDLAAGTLVIKIINHTPPSLKGFEKLKYNSFLQYPLILGQLRAKIDPQSGAALVNLLNRKEYMEASAYHELCAETVKGLKELAVFPEEVTHHLNDEQYIKNIIDYLYL